MKAVQSVRLNDTEMNSRLQLQWLADQLVDQQKNNLQLHWSWINHFSFSVLCHKFKLVDLTKQDICKLSMKRSLTKKRSTLGLLKSFFWGFQLQLQPSSVNSLLRLRNTDVVESFGKSNFWHFIDKPIHWENNCQNKRLLQPWHVKKYICRILLNIFYGFLNVNKTHEITRT